MDYRKRLSKLAICARPSRRRNTPLRRRARGHDRADADGFWHSGRRHSAVCLEIHFCRKTILALAGGRRVFDDLSHRIGMRDHHDM